MRPRTAVAVAGLALAIAIVMTTASGVGVGEPAAASEGEYFGRDSCTYVHAGPPGPVGNKLVVVDGYTVRLSRKGQEIVVHNYGPRCTGGRATVNNTDRIVVKAEGEGVILDEDDGRFAPGPSPEASGAEIELTIYAERLEFTGSPGADVIVARTLADGRVALNTDRAADGRSPDLDVTLMAGVPDLLKIRGYKGDDRIDARRLSGMGDNHLDRVIRLFGDAGDDTILGSPGGEWRLKDGPGNDLVVAGGGFDSVDFGRGRDTIYGGPGGDDLIYSTWERFSGAPADAPDRLFGGGGEDQIIDLNGHSDLIRCGSGRDDVEREPGDRLASDCEHRRY